MWPKAVVVLLLLFVATATVETQLQQRPTDDVNRGGHSMVMHHQPLAPGLGRVGVQLQWGTRPLQPGLIANLSTAFDVARIDFLWTMVEQQPSNYTFVQYDQLLAQLKLHNVTAAWNLDYGNNLWQNGTGVPFSVAVTSPAGVAAFARFAVASVRHFRGQGIVWGMYNEPNGHGYADPAGYITLVLAVGSALRAAGLADEIVTGPHIDGGFPILMGLVCFSCIFFFKRPAKQNLDSRCVLVPAPWVLGPWVLGPKHVSNPA